MERGLSCHSALRSIAFLLLLIPVAAVAWGSAFSIAEQGAKARGMGTAFTSIADDGSAMHYNPAGIAFQDAIAVVGLFPFFPSATQPHFIPVGTMTLAKQLSPRLTFGFGVYAPSGLSANPAVTKYPGRFAGTRAALQSYWIQPTVAYKVTLNSSVAIGTALVHTHLFIVDRSPVVKFVGRTTAVSANNIKYTNGEYSNFAHVAGAALRLTLGGAK